MKNDNEKITIRSTTGTNNVSAKIVAYNQENTPNKTISDAATAKCLISLGLK